MPPQDYSSQAEFSASKMGRVVLTGGSGLLALNWACCMRSRYEVLLAQHHRRIALHDTGAVLLTLESAPELERQVRSLRPDLLVHTAGLTSVDECEKQPELAWRLNARLAQNVAQVAETLGVKVIHISTDHLFSGSRKLMSEQDKVEPLNEYARTKLAAEQFVIKEAPSALILRTNFFGWGSSFRKSFTDWIIESLRSGKRLTMFDDVFFTPILADTLAHAGHELIEHNASGIYHVGGDVRISKYDFGLLVAERFGLPKAYIECGKITSIDLPAARPHDMSLESSHARDLLKRRLGSPVEQIEQLWRQEREGRSAEIKKAVS